MLSLAHCGLEEVKEVEKEEVGESRKKNTKPNCLQPRNS